MVGGESSHRPPCSTPQKDSRQLKKLSHSGCHDSNIIQIKLADNDETHFGQYRGKSNIALDPVETFQNYLEGGSNKPATIRQPRLILLLAKIIAGEDIVRAIRNNRIQAMSALRILGLEKTKLLSFMET